ncbi:hypothetical protein SLEP1_g53494 [Rubroshorea leprosula]|uniref:Uncharacterized protein n=1 Tax=Rubroshorea leprosula TaxID=152421 RepID=A0AAV5MAI8_9ROSI|nr:hypothetical protein SLEP1_g53494 [Rubroshorea leprosula]
MKCERNQTRRLARGRCGLCVVYTAGSKSLSVATLLLLPILSFDSAGTQSPENATIRSRHFSLIV